MRKIELKENVEKKEKRRKAIIGIFLIAIMFLSTAGYAFFGRDSSSSDSTSDNPNDNNGEIYNGRYWTYDLNGQKAYFTNKRDSLSLVPVQITAGFGDYAGKKIYIDANSEVLNEISINLGRYIDLQPACYGQCEKDLPEKDCTEKMIIFKESETEKVYQNQSCIFIDGKNDLKAVDAFLDKIMFGA